MECVACCTALVACCAQCVAIHVARTSTSTERAPELAECAPVCARCVAVCVERSPNYVVREIIRTECSLECVNRDASFTTPAAVFVHSVSTCVQLVSICVHSVFTCVHLVSTCVHSVFTSSVRLEVEVLQRVSGRPFARS